ncbi:hypothetical protein A3E96_00130 [Candidatus Uhrbacteria bacterium RIFCSPHIGHO2_12_FULL_46_13]|nr:MAG: hypothetical protein A3D60_00510 [Candidatus Uhrbacteria bacterium RIFCSPHIGHO2_02_FULL_47_29]OGL75030.1 MAG: hypothetical protein A3E96_00130 [Candidatus Uhrbacteria bacterium RIFCSPHIGHO2_12_FULL_46_13]OGL84519.1 MAG: hypothetical protein A3I37_04505 [Candidatus Uhrbacteria bacterium RIFCSPLOWO2_02_FULL_46_19]
MIKDIHTTAYWQPCEHLDNQRKRRETNMEKLIVVCHGEPDYQSVRLSTRGRRQAFALAKLVGGEIKAGYTTTIIRCQHSYPQETASIIMAQLHVQMGNLTKISRLFCPHPLYALDLLNEQMEQHAVIFVGHAEDALYLPPMYGLLQEASLNGFAVSYGEAIVIDCEAMKASIITPVRE